MPRLEALLICSALAATAGTARADAQTGPRPSADISAPWIAPPGCPTTADFLDYLSHELGVDVGADELPLRAVVERGAPTVDGSAPPWRARVRDRDGRERVLEDASCTELARTTALVIATAVNELLVPAAPPPWPVRLSPQSSLASPAPSSPGVAGPSLPVDAGVAALSSDPDAIAVRLRGGAAFDAGTCDNGVAPGWTATLEAGRGPWSVDLGIGLWSVGYSSDALGGSGVRLAMISGTSHGCRSWSHGRRRAFACGGAEVARVDGWAYSGTEASGRSLVLGLQGGGGAAWRLVGPIALRVEGTLGAIVAHTAFDSMPMTSAPTPGPLLARVQLGLELQAW